MPSANPNKMSLHDNAELPDASLRNLVLRSVLSVAAIVVCTMLLQQRFADIEWLQVERAIGGISTAAVLLALLLGLISHLGLAGYDLLAFARIGRRIPWSRALKGGFAGTVTSQVVGFGLITGSYVRSRIYRANQVSLAQAVAVTGYVAAGFFSGLSVLLAFLTLIDPSPVANFSGFGTTTVTLATLTILVAIATLAWRTRKGSVEVALGSMKIRLPDGAWLTGATMLAAFDLVPAALCLLVLLPDAAAPSLGGFIAIYVAAVASGHIVGSPGAVGPFEAVIFLALPEVAIADLTAAVIVYRLLYYIPPFVMTAGFVLFANKEPDLRLETGTTLRNSVDWIMDGACSAEAELAYLGDKHVFLPEDASAFAMYGIYGRTWLVLGDPVGAADAWQKVIGGLEAEAHAAGATLAVYKATWRSRPFWEQKGYRLDPLGQEGIIDAQNFSTSGSSFRELRRKVSTTLKAGVTFETFSPGEAPLRKLATIADAWRDQKNGLEQTFSMGHWQPEFTARHWVVVASTEKTDIAFLSCWVSGDGSEWMIDLMRQRPDAPNGTMHALVAEAIIASKSSGATHFNMCAAPMSGFAEHSPKTAWTRIGEALYRRFESRHGLSGVRRFKAIFRPEWKQRYLVSKSLLGAMEAAIAAHALIHRKSQSSTAETSRTPVLPCPKASIDDADALSGLAEPALISSDRAA